MKEDLGDDDVLISIKVGLGMWVSALGNLERFEMRLLWWTGSNYCHDR